MYKLGAENIVKEIKDSISTACKSVDEAVNALSNGNVKPMSFSTHSQTTGPSYANAVRSVRSSNPTVRKIKLGRCKMIIVDSTKRVMIKPAENAKKKYTDSQKIRDVLHKSVDPAALQLNVKRVFLSKDNCCVTIEGDSLDPLIHCKSLAVAGLEVTADTKLDPRVIIHSIPVEYDKDDIANFIVSQNFSSFTEEDFNVIYMYPAGKKKFRSCVIQMKPAARDLLFEREKICIGWQLCKFADH